MQIVLRAARLPLPGDAAENRQPIVRRTAILAWIRPHVPVCKRVIAAFSACLKPRVFNRCMTQYLVDDHLDPETVSLLEHRLEVRHGSKYRINRSIIGNVV